MASDIIEFDGIQIEVTRKAIKHLYFRINRSNGQVQISAPSNYNEKLLRQHLEAKKDWIHKQRQRLIQPKPIETKALQDGDKICFLGKSYQLIIQNTAGVELVLINDDQLLLYVKKNTNHKKKQAILDHWYKQQMQQLIPDLLQHWAKTIGVKPSEWRIRKMKTRWGSCNTREKRIWLNLRLMEKPLRCIELVIVHELVHLLEPSHNKRFYKFMSHYLPEWKQSHRILEGKVAF